MKNLRKLVLFMVACLGAVGVAWASVDKEETTPVLCKVFPAACTPTINTGGNGGGIDPPDSEG